MAQLELFTLVETPISTTPTVESVRARIESLLAQLRAADALPWTPKEAARWNLILPQMADWLPPDERDAARLEFSRLMNRFDRAFDSPP